jgi:hypothetical protein
MRIGMISKFVVLGMLMMASTELLAATEKAAAPEKIKYRTGKDLNFEALIIEGQNKRPELSVVTGDSDSSMNGLLRLRENFVDKMTADLGEEAR